MTNLLNQIMASTGTYQDLMKQAIARLLQERQMQNQMIMRNQEQANQRNMMGHQLEWQKRQHKENLGMTAGLGLATAGTGLATDMLMLNAMAPLFKDNNISPADNTWWADSLLVAPDDRMATLR